MIESTVNGIFPTPIYMSKLDRDLTKKELTEYQGKFEVIKVPNITNICYGRKVGYNIEEIVLPKEIQEISATTIRKNLK